MYDDAMHFSTYRKTAEACVGIVGCCWDLAEPPAGQFTWVIHIDMRPGREHRPGQAQTSAPTVGGEV